MQPSAAAPQWQQSWGRQHHDHFCRIPGCRVLAFGAVAVPKGSYVLTAVKDDKGGWTVIVSAPDGKTKVAEVPLTFTVIKDPVEQFTIAVTGKGNAGELSMSWGTAKMAAAFTAK